MSQYIQIFIYSGEIVEKKRDRMSEKREAARARKSSNDALRSIQVCTSVYISYIYIYVHIIYINTYI
jgi:hypothetical protein